MCLIGSLVTQPYHLRVEICPEQIRRIKRLVKIQEVGADLKITANIYLLYKFIINFL